MIREIYVNDLKIQYELQYKKVKNINLRIKQDGKIYVSANKYVSVDFIDEFVISKSDLIKKTLEKIGEKEKTIKKQYFDDNEIENIILKICEKIYPYYKEKGIEFPQIKFRKMTSQWGNCRAERRILTFNKNLMYAPYESIEYVVFHEFTHFLQANHSKKFYSELSKVCPDWKERRKKLMNIL